MKNKIFLLPFYLVFGSCISQSNTKVNISNNNLIGCWKLKDNGMSYVQLYFKKDSTAIVTSRADTIYRFSYWADKNYLILEAKDRLYKCPIIECSDSTLSFKDEIINNKILNYRRDSCKSE